MTAPPVTGPRRSEDRRENQLYRRIALILRVGFLLSLAMMLLGLVIVAARGQQVAGDVIPLSDLSASLRDVDGQAVIDLGILVLLATPLAHVIVALVTFARQRDVLFVGVCTLLILILAGSVGLALV